MTYTHSEALIDFGNGHYARAVLPISGGSGEHSGTVVNLGNDRYALAYIQVDESGQLVEALPRESVIINGNYDHWQRGTGALTHTTTYNSLTSYSADRFFTLPAGASLSSQRSTTVPDNKSLYSVQINGAASVTTVDHGQRIRAGYAGRYRQSLVFSAYIRNESGAAFTPNLRVGTPTGADNFGTVTNRLDQALQECADAAWTRVSHVFDPSAYTDIANGLEVALRVPSGSLVSGDVVRVAQFDLRPGTYLMPYEPPDVEAELQRCLRYRFAIGGDASQECFCTGQAFSTTQGLFSMPLPVPMRTVPTATVSAATDFGLRQAASALTECSALALHNSSSSKVAVMLGTVGSAVLAAGNATQLIADTTLDARIVFSAEL